MSEAAISTILWLIPVAPLAAAVVIALLGPQWLRERSHLPCWFGLGDGDCVRDRAVVLDRAGTVFTEHGSTAAVAAGYQWIDVGGLSVGHRSAGRRDERRSCSRWSRP